MTNIGHEGFSGPRSRRRASQGKSGKASLLFEPVARFPATGELGERRFSREAEEAVGGSGACFLWCGEPQLLRGRRRHKTIIY